MQHVDPYKSAAELGITKDEKKRLLVASMIIEHAPDFHMPCWEKCIKGFMYQDEVTSICRIESSEKIKRLFNGGSQLPCWKAAGCHPMAAKREQAVIAINHFLIHGE